MQTTPKPGNWNAYRDLQHPMEIFPVLRRFPPSFLRNLLYTFLFNTLIAIVFTALASMFSGTSIRLWQVFKLNLLISNCIGFCMGFSLDLLTKFYRKRSAFEAKPTVFVTLTYLAVAIVCTLVGYAIAAAILGWSNWQTWLFSPQNIIVISVFCAAISLFVMLLYRNSFAHLEAERSAALAAAELEASKRAAATAELKALRAQVEPHFLYNSLAHVTTLIDQDPAKAKLMLDRLISLLRNNVEGSRDNVSSLQRELTGVENYLGILKLRMGDRLSFNVRADESARMVAVPPMLLQPIVENAIKHGIEPKIEGGHIDVDAQRVGDVLRVTVRDTGLGFGVAQTSSTGTGLPNLKARLRATCGERASVQISETSGGGVTVALIIPLSAPTL